MIKKVMLPESKSSGRMTFIFSWKRTQVQLTEQKPDMIYKTAHDPCST